MHLYTFVMVHARRETLIDVYVFFQIEYDFIFAGFKGVDDHKFGECMSICRRCADLLDDVSYLLLFLFCPLPPFFSLSSNLLYCCLPLLLLICCLSNGYDL